MGTRSLTHVKDDVWNEQDTPKTVVTIYRQMDGYPTGMGKDLLDFLAGRRITNGIGYGDTGPTSNGMGELAAQLVQALKADSPDGGIYLYPPDSTDVGEEYVYTISNRATRNGDALNLRVEYTYRGGRVLYDGPPSGFDPKAAEDILSAED